MERDLRIMLDVEEILAFQLVILHAASGIDAGRLNLDIQNPRLTSVDVNLRVASHLSNLPVIATEDFTLNELSSTPA